MILGHHTVAECYDLLRQYDWRIDAIDNTIKHNAASFPADLISDWNSFITRWKTARASIISSLPIAQARANAVGMATGGAGALVGAAVGADVAPAENEFNAILKAGSASYPAYTDKDLPGLEGRVNAIKPVIFGDMPKNKASDIDAGLYSASDYGIKKGEDALLGFAKQHAVEIGFGLAGLYLAKRWGLL